MDFLKAALTQAEASKSVKLMLHRKLSGYRQARSLKVVHASDVTDPQFCGRFFAISDLLDFAQKDEWLTTSQAVTFEIGKVLQDSIVHWLADVGVAVGHWRCTSCKWTHSFCKRPAYCTQCNCRAMKPVEVSMQSLVSGVSGSFDCLVNVGEAKLRILEIKTIDKDQFKTLSQPLPEHVARTKLYMRLVAESGAEWADRIDTTTAAVLYASKGGFGVQDFSLQEHKLNDKFSPFKEYLVSRDDNYTQVVSDKGRQVTEWRRGEGPMPKRLCQSALDKPAKYCPLRTACFSDAFPDATPPKYTPEMVA